eukprot:Blabericola_migrator_1__10973@NODE_6359_length_551_cov_1_464876_g4314_i0_p1_GENE_NODE_6359_length_551_cov_1_464876_g4314_i0NODE_6359_length_551_cov_1_464876_g4314_i0_p1_ORF_typecomplete_len116_score3_39TagA/PF12561_8/0_052Phlebovirus_G2/PF07245_11/0_077_NODE_6359_length_551_cov_1_464876_g4314_i062409
MGCGGMEDGCTFLRTFDPLHHPKSRTYRVIHQKYGWRFKAQVSITMSLNASHTNADGQVGDATDVSRSATLKRSRLERVTSIYKTAAFPDLEYLKLLRVTRNQLYPKASSINLLR